jgi:outer membrane receptor protein involved in Fe transport
VFSLAYVRLQQDPNREFLYDNRTVVTNRIPLGNPGLTPAEVISYQGAVKHLFSQSWAGQLGLFYRDVFGQVGARNYSFLPGADELRFTNEDQSHAIGFEASLLHETDRRHAELHYTYMQAYGSESRPEGDPYGLVRGPRTPPIEDLPLSWDRRHSIGFSGYWPMFERWVVAWNTNLGSGLPWTPKPRRELFEDLSVVNSERFGWSENTDLSLRWNPPITPIPLTVGFEVRNLFDNRTDRVATVDGYPHALINTVFDDYGAYRTETGLPGGAYWYDLDQDGTPEWVPVHDPRLLAPPRRLRLSVGARW